MLINVPLDWECDETGFISRFQRTNHYESDRCGNAEITSMLMVSRVQYEDMCKEKLHRFGISDTIAFAFEKGL
jgi:predicted XRE-type DNA-binding protein